MHVGYFFIAALIALLPIFFIFKKEKNKGHKYYWIPLLCRWMIFTILLNLLLQPSFLNIAYKEKPSHLVVLVDSSASMKQSFSYSKWSNINLENIIRDNIDKNIELSFQYFSDGLRFDSNTNSNVTDLGKSIQQTLQLHKNESTKGILLISDGIYNQGVDPKEIARYSTLPIFSIGIGDTTQLKDLSIDKIYVNKTISANTDFEVIADIGKQKVDAAAFDVKIKLNGKLLNTKRIVNDDQLTVQQIAFQLNAPKPGIYTYEIELPILDGEHNVNNNKKQFTIEVLDEALSILLWQQAPHPDIAAIKNSLEQSAIHKVVIHTGNAIPENVEKYALIILHNIVLSNIEQNASLTGKPKWYIIGTQSNINSLNQNQKFVKGIPQNVIHNIFPVFNSSFNIFQQPNNVASITEILPPMSGVYFDGGQVSKSDILLYQKVGYIQTAIPLWFFNLNNASEAYTLGEGLWRWKIHEYKQNKNTDVIDNFIQQTVNALAIKTDERPLKLFLDDSYLTEDIPVIFQANLKNSAGKLINNIPISLVLTDSMGKKWQFNMDPFGNGYKANIGKFAAGSYQATASCSFANKKYYSNVSLLINNISLEQVNTIADFKILNEISNLSGGLFFAANQINEFYATFNSDARFKTSISEERSQKKLIDYPWILFLLIALCSLEWVVRKYWQS